MVNELNYEERVRRLNFYGSLCEKFGIYSDMSQSYISEQSDERLIKLAEMYRVLMASFAEVKNCDVGSIDDIESYKQEYPEISKSIEGWIKVFKDKTK